MIRNEVYIERYDWHIRVYYAVTCYYVDEIMNALSDIDCPIDFMNSAYRNMSSCTLDNGITYSNSDCRESVVVIGRASSPREYLNSICHELRHLQDHIALCLNMDIGGEEIAYLSGDIAGELWEDINILISNCKCHYNHLKQRIYG